MTKLKELEQRLRDEPDNLGLRVVVAGALHEAGRRADAVELYRSVAIAYRDQGRQQQAIAVCRSILELAPEDAACHALLAALLTTAPAPRASPPPGARPSPMPSRPSPMPGARPSPMPSRPSPLPSRPSPSPLPRPSEPSPLRPSEPLLWRSEPLLRPSEPEPLPRPSEPLLRPSEPPLRPSELTAADPLVPLPDPTAARPLLRPSEPLLRPSEPPLRPSELTAADPLVPLPDPTAARPLLRPSEPLRPSELTAADPLRRSSGEMTPLPAPLAYHDADPTIGTLQRLSPSDLPPSLRDELAAYPEIAGIAAAARQISASLIAASRMIEQTEELDDDDLSAEVDTGRLLRSGAPKLPPSASVPPPMRRPPTPPPMPPPVRRPPTPSPAPRAAALGPAAPATTGPRAAALGSSASPAAVLAAGLPASAADDDEPTLPPSSAAAQPGPIDDEKTEPRELPTRVRPPSIAPPTVATGPLASAFFAPLPPRNRAAVLQRFRRRMVAPGTAVIRRGETGHGLVIVVRGRLELRAEGAAGAPVALAAFEPGDYLGEASLLARAPAAAQVVAATDSELLVLADDDFYDVTSAFPALRAELEATAARRARDLDPRGGGD